MKIFYKPEQRPAIDPAIARQTRDAFANIFARYAEADASNDDPGEPDCVLDVGHSTAASQ